MVTMRQIREVGRQIGRRFRPSRVVLFGSYADGKPTEDSDVDLLIIMPFDGNAAEKSAQVRLGVNPPFPVDVIVRHPKAVRERIAMGDTFLRNILRNGKVIYEAHRR